MIHGIEEFRVIYNKFNNNTSDRFLYHFHQQFEEIECSGKKILDIGCGKGFTALAFASLSHDTEVTAIDEYEGFGEDQKNYDFFLALLKEYDVSNVQLLKTDFLKNDFPNNSFDVVIANYSLHHIVRTKGYITTNKATELVWFSVLEEIKRILKDGGILVLKEMTRSSIWKYIPLRAKGIDWMIHPTKKELIQILKKIFSGKIIAKNVVNYRLKKLLPVLKKNSLFTFFVTPDFYLILRK